MKRSNKAVSNQLMSNQVFGTVTCVALERGNAVERIVAEEEAQDSNIAGCDANETFTVEQLQFGQHRQLFDLFMKIGVDKF